MRLDFETIGNCQKDFERVEAGRAIMPGIPVMARLDGRAFHSFTQGLERPYDISMSENMIQTAEALLDHFGATVAYTQSDEITLCWANPDELETKVIFSGKFQKLCSVLASTATVRFNKLVEKYLPKHSWKEPVFDCRVWQVPSLKVAAENFLWREWDASKNSITMAASFHFSPKQLHGVGSKDKIKLLEQKGIFWPDYPDFFKRGTYLKKVKVNKYLTSEELQMIKPEFRPLGPVERSEIQEMNWPRAFKISNFADVLFANAEPVIENEEQHGTTNDTD